MTEIYVSWSDYHHKIEALSTKIYQSNWQFNQIICIARGGLRVGDILSRIYNVPLAVLSASSYIAAGVQGELKLASKISMINDRLGDRVLLVDDLVDSGITLSRTLDWLKCHQDYDISEAKTAVIWCKAISKFIPDFYVDFLSDNPWIHQPFEIYDHASAADIALKAPSAIDQSG